MSHQRPTPKLIRFNEVTEDEYFCTEDGAKAGVTFENTSETEPLVCLRYFGPEVNPDAPAMGAYRKNKFNCRACQLSRDGGWRSRQPPFLFPSGPWYPSG